MFFSKIPSPSNATTHGSSPEKRFAAVRHARHRLLSEGPQAGLTGIEPWIASSWQRCLSSGLRPEQHIVFAPNPKQGQHRLVEAHHELLIAASPSMHSLGGLVAGIGYFALLTNQDGVVIDVAGKVDRSDQAAASIAQVGVDLSEGSAGTSAICTALSEKHPVWLHQTEHYFEDTSVYSCAGAPIMSPQGQCLGMLDLTGIRVREQRQLVHLVAQYAHEIERAILLGQGRKLLLRLSWPGTSGFGSLQETGLLSLDDTGRVLGADQVAKRMVPELDQHFEASALVKEPLHISGIFATQWQGLFDLAQREQNQSEIPMWAGLSLHVEAISAQSPSRPTRERAHLASGRNGSSLKEVQSVLIHQAMHEARGNVETAAKRLGISRATLYRKLHSRH